jgi:hypothetical protein
LNYYRIPITAEAAPEDKDFEALLQIVTRSNVRTTCFIMYVPFMSPYVCSNCQIGMGRSTLGSVIVALVIYWMTGTAPPVTTEDGTQHYQIIHSLLRVIRGGLECKQRVDQVISHCATHLHLRKSIENARLQAEAALDDESKHRAIQRGLMALRRYFLVIAFQSYLESSPGSINEMESFSAWMSRHQVLVSCFGGDDRNSKQCWRIWRIWGNSRYCPSDNSDPATGWR